MNIEARSGSPPRSPLCMLLQHITDENNTPLSSASIHVIGCAMPAPPMLVRTILRLVKYRSA